MRQIYSTFLNPRCRISALKVKWMTSWDSTDLWTEDQLLGGRKNQLSADVLAPLPPHRFAILRGWTRARLRRRRRNRWRKRQEKPKRLQRTDLSLIGAPWTLKRTIIKWSQLIARTKKTSVSVLRKPSSRRTWQKTCAEATRTPEYLPSRTKHQHLEKVSVK